MTLTMMRGFAAALGVSVAFGAAAAQAQEQRPDYSGQVPRGETVTERQRPDLDPLGIRAASFLVFPRFTLGEAYNDNVFATQSNTKDDFITQISPELRIQSNWNRHFLAFDARGDIGRYASLDSENYEDATIGTNGRLDIQRDTFVTGGLTFNKLHEDRGSPDAAANAKNPTEYYVLSPTIGATQRWNRFSLRGDATLQRYMFTDDETGSGTIINNSDRNRSQYTFSLRGGYEIVPEYEAFVRGAWNLVDYSSAVDDAGFKRDSDGYELIAGTRIDFSGVTYGDIFGGYRRQMYDDARLESVSGPTFGGLVTWNVTGLTTIKGSIQRSVEESTLSGASGFFATEYKATVDHELLRNLLIGADISYLVDDYKGIDRTDNYYHGGAYARYLMNRNLYLTARYDYQKRDSNVTGADYDRNVVLLQVSTQL
jgi:hypothetical protein